MFWRVLFSFGLVYTVRSIEYCDESFVKNLPENAITSSTNYTSIRDEKQYGAQRAKYTTIAGSFPDEMAGAWVAETVDTNQWLQIDLQAPGIVKEIITKGRNIDIWTGCCQQWVTSYYVQYSLDSTTWTSTNNSAKTSLFNGNNNTDDAVSNTLECPIIARYIRISPQSWHGHIAMRADVRGCYIEMHTSSSSEINNIPQLRDDPPYTEYETVIPSQTSDISTISEWRPTTIPAWRQFLFPETNGNRFVRETTTPVNWYARDYNGSLSELQSNPKLRPWRRVINNNNQKPRYTVRDRLNGPTGFAPRAFVPQEGVIAPKVNDRCVESCFNRRDGDYQSCRSCRVYVSCSGGYTYDQRSCPGNLVWNDKLKICDWTSPTCP